MIRASKKGTTAKFTDGIWKTGIPQKAGWIAEKEEQASGIIPREIVDLSNIQKQKIEHPDEVPGAKVIETIDEAPTAPVVKKKAGVVAAAKKGGKRAAGKQKK